MHLVMGEGEPESQHVLWKNQLMRKMETIRKWENVY